MRLSDHVANGKCKMATNVYIDGFNLYYGALRGTPYKWLDLMGLFQGILGARHNVQKIKFFTALVMPRQDPSSVTRQNTYLGALNKHCPNFEPIFGYFAVRPVTLPLENPGKKGRRMVRVIKTEEKGTDVNIAVHLLHDAWLDNYDCAVLISNDGDLAEALRLVRSDCKKKIGLISPSEDQPIGKLSKHADFISHITPAALKKNQLPSPIPGTRIFKPKEW